MNGIFNPLILRVHMYKSKDTGSCPTIINFFFLGKPTIINYLIEFKSFTTQNKYSPAMWHTKKHTAFKHENLAKPNRA